MYARSSRCVRVRLTAQAELLVAHAEALLAEMERAESALPDSLGHTVGTLRVAAFQTAVMALVPPALTGLRITAPRPAGGRTELEPHIALPAMVAGDHDLVIAEGYPGPPLPHLPEVERRDPLADDLLLATPATWRERSLNDGRTPVRHGARRLAR